MVADKDHDIDKALITHKRPLLLSEIELTKPSAKTYKRRKLKTEPEPQPVVVPEPQPVVVPEPQPVVVPEQETNGVFFCTRCNILMRSDKEMMHHLRNTKHDEFLASLSQEHNLFCVKCKLKFSSVTELEEHTKMGEEDHKVFVRIVLQPEQDEDVTVLDYEEEAYEEDVCVEECDEADVSHADHVSDENNEEHIDSMYSSQLRLSQSDDSEYGDPLSQPIQPPGPERTLKNLNISANERKVLRDKYVIAEAVTTEVALKRVQHALAKFAPGKRIICRKRSIEYEPSLWQLCFKKTTAGTRCGKDRSDRLKAVLEILGNLLEERGCIRENSLHYMYREELNEPRLKPGLLSNRITKAITDLSAMLRISREAFGIRASAKGLIRGAVLLHVNGKLIANCLLGGDSGTTIPSESDQITSIYATDKIRFVLVVEKETIFQHLTEKEFHLTAQCILITGKGQPDVATRIVLRKLRNTFSDIPFYALVDGNPCGISIFCTYCIGSEERAHDNLFLTVPDLQFIGLNVAEINKKDLKELSETEKRRVAQILNKDYLPTLGFACLRSNLSQMLEKGKADIDVLTRINKLLNYLERHIPEVLVEEKGSWKSSYEDDLVNTLAIFSEYRSENEWTSEGWQLIVEHLNKEHPEAKFTMSEVQEKAGQLKESYKTVKSIIGTNGISWNPETCMITCTDEKWNEIVEEYSELRRFEGNTFHLYPALDQLHNDKKMSTHTSSQE